jgi:hypothetical protein
MALLTALTTKNALPIPDCVTLKFEIVVERISRFSELVFSALRSE